MVDDLEESPLLSCFTNCISHFWVIPIGHVNDGNGLLRNNLDHACSFFQWLDVLHGEAL
uniref:Uncharacterized protein n=1 Tax=Lotus japonicus TaxID=34305 RepID=I3SSM4_LOTJA|nr:unknown [Lotus japonicus]